MALKEKSEYEPIFELKELIYSNRKLMKENKELKEENQILIEELEEARRYNNESV